MRLSTIFLKHKGWGSKSIQFSFDKRFSVEYGQNQKKGALEYLCMKPEINIINCKSLEKERKWEIVFDYIFSEEGLINQSFFITKSVGKIEDGK